jgi:hypothetical protein
VGECRTCDGCDGCGLVSNIDQNTPWSNYVGNDSDQDTVVIDDQTHYPVACPKCGGLGNDRVNADTQGP